MQFQQSIADNYPFQLNNPDQTSDSNPEKTEYSLKAQKILDKHLIGCSQSVQVVRELITQVAPSDCSVLIMGESGTGKEIVANTIHALSTRSKYNFVPVNCGAIPADLLESELFGHEKGSFTGAVTSRKGRFEIAEGGTLFLDEIGDMPLSMQVKLLRVLQEKTYERVGSNKTSFADVRIIAATHQNLEQLVAEGKFRMDLYYRLCVFPIEIPSLRERVEDIPRLVNCFTQRMEKKNLPKVRFHTDVIAALSHYDWPGNVRELLNLVERLAILYPNQEVVWSQLPDKFRPNHDWIAELEPDIHEERSALSAPDNCMEELIQSGVDLKTHVENIERNFIVLALQQTSWVVARAAKLLKMQRTTLVEKMRKYDIERP